MSEYPIGYGPKRKWRPSLSLIVFLVLSTMLSLPLVGLYFFRIDENQLVQQTEAELIAEAAVLAPEFRHEIEADVPDHVPLGAAVETPRQPTADDPYQPIVPTLDLGRDELLERRPDAIPPSSPPDPSFLSVGSKLAPDLVEAQRITLSGFRLLDPQGIVIAGREEVGLSLAHVEEVAAALRGHFRSVMRKRVLDHEPPPLYSVSRGTETRVFVAMPVIVRGHVAGVIYLSRTPNNVLKQLYDERRQVAIAGLTVAIIALLIGFVFHRTITRPVRELIARTTMIGHGDRTAIRPLSHHGTAEFARLSQSFLDMAASLNRRSDFISTFAAHVSHELKSPLTSIKGAAELLRDDIASERSVDDPNGTMSDAERRRFLDNIIGDAARLASIAERLRDLARAENQISVGNCALSAIIPSLSSRAEPLQIRASGDLDCQINISSEDMLIILSHLADNAAQHSATRLEIDAVRAVDQLDLTIRDNGMGISPNNRNRIFDSFFTTRREAGGTGMGLAIVRAMLQAHGGKIELIVDGNPGAAFRLSIPTL